MKPSTGRCAILFPHGVLFRNEERTMREKIVESDVIECILGLGPNLFYNSPMEACVLVCRMNKPPERRGKILFINAVNEVTRERAQSFLTDAHIESIVSAYRAFDDVDGFARVATKEAVSGMGANLSIPMYVRSANGGTKSNSNGASLQRAISVWRKSSEALRASMDELFEVLEGVQTPGGRK